MKTREKPWIATAMALMVCLSKSVIANHCPSECKCKPIASDRNRTMNDCSNRALQTLPEHYSHKAVKLNISFNHFTQLDANFFGQGSHRLDSVYLNNNSIAYIAEPTFWCLPSLWLLDLSGNKLQSLEKFMFRNNTGLKQLILRGNNLKVPASTAFLDAPKLEKLDLSYNDIDSLGDNTFYGFSKLTNLRLNHNRLSALSANWFRDLRRLNHVFLADNQLHILDPDTFVHTPYLIALSLSRNNLMISPGKPFLRILNLQVLYLDGCNLTYLPTEMFEMMTSLRYLHLNDNNLKALEQGTLQHLQDLVSLHACNNLLSCDCDLKDTWLWCKYRSVKSVVSCSVGGTRQVMCAGTWDAVSDINCDATTTPFTTAMTLSSIFKTSAGPPTQSPLEAESSNAGLFIGLALGLSLIGLAIMGGVYWRYFREPSLRLQNNNHVTTTFADMLPLHNENDDT